MYDFILKNNFTKSPKIGLYGQSRNVVPGSPALLCQDTVHPFPNPNSYPCVVVLISHSVSAKLYLFNPSYPTSF